MNRKTIKVLMIEDNIGDARLIEEHLKDVLDINFETIHVDHLSKGIDRVSKGDIDIIQSRQLTHPANLSTSIV